MLKRLLWKLLILVGCFVAAIHLLSSSGSRGFFSPDTLEYRSQSEVLCRGIEVPLYRGSFEYKDHKLVKFLVNKGYWQPRAVASPRWMLLFHYNNMWRDGQSFFNVQFFWKKDHWIEWTTNNPEEASRFWPRILELIRDGEEEKAAEILFEVRSGHTF